MRYGHWDTWKAHMRGLHGIITNYGGIDKLNSHLSFLTMLLVLSPHLITQGT